MALSTANSQTGPAEAYGLIRATAQGARQQAQVAHDTLAAGNVAAPWVFSVLDQFHGFISQLQGWSAVSGLDDYATGQGYSGSMLADCNSCITAAQACINWVVTNFPTSGGYLLSETLNADGSRTLRQFTPTQTAGWQTALNSFIATIN
jgi:hypothetical protein